MYIVWILIESPKQVCVSVSWGGGGGRGEISKYGCHGWVEMGEQGMREREI